MFCPKNVATAEMLKAHTSKVHGNAMANAAKSSSYDCKVCCLKFISFSGLSRHLKMKHGIRGGAVGGDSSSSGGVGGQNSQSRVSAPAVEINVSSTSTPVTIDFKSHSNSAAPSKDTVADTDSWPTANKSLSEEDFLRDLSDTPPAPSNIAPPEATSGEASYKCGNCFLFFDDATDFAQHRQNCG